MVILLRGVDAATARAVGYARSARPREITAIALSEADAHGFDLLAPDIPVTIIEGPERPEQRIKAHLNARKVRLPAEEFFSLLVPEMLEGDGLWEILRRPGVHRLKAAFLGERSIQVLDIPAMRGDDEVSREPARNHVVVLVSGVHNATLQALEYAETLGAVDLRALNFGLDPSATDRLAEEWLSNRIPVPLEIHDSPFRDIGRSLVDYIHQFEADGVHRVVTVVIPEFIVRKRRHHLLHGQSALLVKRHLLFERGVVVASVPYHLAD